MGGTDLAGRERGAALVEFAIVLPILLALALGIVTFGSAYNQKLGLTNAAREAARYGATLPKATGGWTTKVSDVAVASADGDLDTGVPGRVICVALNDGTGSWSGTSGGPCFSDGRASTEPRVQVEVRRTGHVAVFFFEQDVTLHGRAVSRFEATG